MNFWLILCLILLVFIIGFSIKLHLIRKSLLEIERGLKSSLSTASRQKISVSSRNPVILKICSELNRELEELRQIRNENLNLNKEMKEKRIQIAHDLKTPLTAASGYMELLLSETDKEKREFYLSRIREKMEELKGSSDRIFNYSITQASLNAFSEECFCLNSVAEEVLLSFFQDFKKKNIPVAISLPEIKIMIRSDRTAIEQIFRNLLDYCLVKTSEQVSFELNETGYVSVCCSAPNISFLEYEQLSGNYKTVPTGTKGYEPGIQTAQSLCNALFIPLKIKYLTGEVHFLLDLSKYLEKPS